MFEIAGTPMRVSPHLKNHTLAGWPSLSCLGQQHNLLHGKVRMSATILLIDDNAVQAATRQAILRRAGYFVIAVLSPQRALEQLRNNDFPEPIDLILTDHLMPGMTGSEFVSRLREFQPSLPVLVISGMVEAEDEYRDLGVEFRLKPLLPDNLLASVHRLMSTRTPQAASA
jgi:CheY-like chemotaxis protein